MIKDEKNEMQVVTIMYNKFKIPKHVLLYLWDLTQNMSLMFLQHVSFLVKPPYPYTHETWLTGHNFPSSLILTQLIMKVFFFLAYPPWKIDSNGLWAKATVTGSAQQLCCSPVEFSSPPDGQSSSINKSVLKIEHFEQWRYSKYLHVSGCGKKYQLQGQVFRKQELRREEGG